MDEVELPGYEHHVGFATACKMLGGTFKDEKSTVSCTIPIIGPEYMDFNPPEKIKGAVVIEATLPNDQISKRSIRIRAYDEKGQIRISFGGYQLPAKGQDFICYKTDANADGSLKLVNCRVEGTDLQISTKGPEIRVRNENGEIDQAYYVMNFEFCDRSVTTQGKMKVNGVTPGCVSIEGMSTYIQEE